MSRARFLLAIALLVCAALSHAGPTRRVVLPDGVTPAHYRIDFTPDLQKLTFEGSVEIDVVVRGDTGSIVLNAADLVIESALLDKGAAQLSVAYDEQGQTVTLTADRPVPSGVHTLKLEYRGKVYQNASGLFALDYQDPRSAAGQRRALFTQFEVADARRFVPCWDEPGLKATFELAATLPAALMAVSNMPVTRTEALPGGLQRVQFARSPKMSTYLLFFGAGDFERVHRTVEGVDVGIVVKRGDTAHAAYALDAAVRLLPYYNDYFGTPYPLPKLDLIAGPGSSQFFGAMENWGAIFYFERYLLIDPRISTQADRQNVFGVIAHEVAHQWFGNLVTMAWWDDLWLNEGFASWMAYKAGDHFHPEWKAWLQLLPEKQAVMQRDARDGTHPIVTPIEDATQASNAFDDISYTKGAAVIRALEFHIGEAAFRAGVRRYIREHLYGNTVTDDLWNAIARETAAPVPKIAHDLTLQAGVPMVDMLASNCENGQTVLSLSQTHYAIDAGSTSARVWALPVKVAALGQEPTSTIVSGATPQKVATPGCEPVVLNAGQGGYMRARYSRDGMAAVTRRYGDLTPDDQLGLLHDTMSLATNGDQPMADYLDLTRNVPANVDPVVASALIRQLMQLDRLCRGLELQPAYRTYARGILRTLFAEVGWDARDGESDNTAVLRMDLISALNDLGDPEIVARNRARFDRYLASPAQFSAEARRSVLHDVAVRADKTVWDRLREMAKKANSELERQELYKLLGVPQDQLLARRALSLVLSDEIPKTIRPEVVVSVAEYYPEMALDFAIQHWGELSKMLEVSSAQRFVPSLTTNSADLGTTVKLDAFAAAHVPVNARQDYVLANARVRYLASVRAERLPEVGRWLARH